MEAIWLMKSGAPEQSIGGISSDIQASEQLSPSLDRSRARLSTCNLLSQQRRPLSRWRR
jgi:hypothetical protein